MGVRLSSPSWRARRRCWAIGVAKAADRGAEPSGIRAGSAGPIHGRRATPSRTHPTPPQAQRGCIKALHARRSSTGDLDPPATCRLLRPIRSRTRRRIALLTRNNDETHSTHSVLASPNVPRLPRLTRSVRQLDSMLRKPAHATRSLAQAPRGRPSGGRRQRANRRVICPDDHAVGDHCRRAAVHRPVSEGPRRHEQREQFKDEAHHAPHSARSTGTPQPRLVTFRGRPGTLSDV